MWAGQDTASVKELSLSTACQSKDGVEDQGFSSSLHPRILIQGLCLCFVLSVAFLGMVWSDHLLLHRHFYLCDPVSRLLPKMRTGDDLEGAGRNAQGPALPGERLSWLIYGLVFIGKPEL